MYFLLSGMYHVRDPWPRDSEGKQEMYADDDDDDDDDDDEEEEEEDITRQ